MIYTDNENLEWWKRISSTEKTEILDRMVDRALSENNRGVAMFLRDRWNKTLDLTPRQIASIRKWAWPR